MFYAIFQFWAKVKFATLEGKPAMDSYVVHAYILLLSAGSEMWQPCCGGFVKSDVEINYSVIEIKLYTKQGSLKYQTDCAPINGYFMIPLYDKGDFVIKIEPPSGWSFEPTTVDLHVDGITDICTKEQDINFIFTGFSVLGTVLSKGHLLGPAGVEVSLRKVGEDDVLQSVLTQFCSKKTWFTIFVPSQSSTTVVVSNENAPAAAPLVVKGYDVSGEVQSDSEPMKGVSFLLYSASVTQEVKGFIRFIRRMGEGKEGDEEEPIRSKYLSFFYPYSLSCLFEFWLLLSIHLVALFNFGRSSIESEPALVLGPLRSNEEQRWELQLLEIAAHKKEREERGDENSPPVEEKPDELHEPFRYEFSYWARAGEKITVTPSSKEFLFYPPEVDATITGENCPGQMVEIAGRAGLFLTGQVSPTLEDVEISIKKRGATTPLITVLTDETGTYSVGPLHSDSLYDISASKEGFVLTAVEGNTGAFKAFALAGISFEIKAEDGVPLSGVLLSLSGANFRSNMLTQDTGLLTFNNLSPGQYYFKPMMKEFRFEPSAQMITLEEGQVLHIPITGFKTAYSCYGTVQSIGGDAEQGVAVEAVGQGECGVYSEDTVTDEEGRFRLRGLRPGCNYNIQLRGEGTDHIERALPPHKTIEVGSTDIEGINIIAFRQINQFDLSGNVITSPEHLPTLWVKLYKRDNPDNPFQSVSLGQSLFFHFAPLPREGESYVLMLDTSLSHSQYDYKLPQVSFTSSGYHKHVTLTFNPKRRIPDQDVAQGSFIALPLTLLLLLAVYNHERVIPLLLQLVSQIQGVRGLAQASGDGLPVDEAKRQSKRPKTRRT
uniref:Nodal modulator 1-like n=1 Tax=Sinocyclocheilus grahami TaxID=75366 RepID=A0A672MCX4_SINGR